MSTSQSTPAEINAAAIRILCREMGPVNTSRFLNQYTAGIGNYTEERDDILGKPTVDELVAEIQKKRAKKVNNKSKSKRAR